MQRKFTFLNLIFGCISLLLIGTKFSSNVAAEEPLEVQLSTEIKKGKFLIGLKQYLGGENDSFSKNKNIHFIPDKGFLNLISSNGIKYKSKQINISWVDIPIKNPKTIERIVFGPFASYESAKKQAEKLKDKGYETTVAYPKNWEVWIPFEDIRFTKPLSVIKLIFFFLEKLSFTPPRYCFIPIKKFPFLISVLSSIFNNSSATEKGENIALIFKRNIHPKNKFK